MDTIGNSNAATESVCPNGWTLPTNKQASSNKATSNFNPVLGGYYDNGTPGSESASGTWWGSDAPNGTARYYLGYDGSNLGTGSRLRFYGRYIRCVSEEKTVLDLTYMQDMTPKLLC